MLLCYGFCLSPSQGPVSEQAKGEEHSILVIGGLPAEEGARGA